MLGWNEAVEAVRGIEELAGLADDLQDLKDAKDGADVAAIIAKIAAEAAVTGITAAELRVLSSAFKVMRLDYAVSGKIDRWQAWSTASGVGAGLAVGKAIDWVNNQHYGAKVYDWTHPDPKTNSYFRNAQNWVPRSDPLTIDLDGDGLETIGISQDNPIVFDHDGDGIKTGSGWIKSDDAFLVIDKNGNGQIDSGRELFGDNTIKADGTNAIDGFDALSEMDSNMDGFVNSSDSQFNNLRVWRDINQDGISQSSELFSLQDVGIKSISVNKTENSTVLSNGNELADVGVFYRENGGVGNIGALVGNVSDINLLDNKFYRVFSEYLDTSDVADLPDINGSGLVRDLLEAVTLSDTLENIVIQYSVATSRAEQMSLLDDLLEKWADTSGMFKTLDDRVSSTNGLTIGAGTAAEYSVPYVIRYQAFGNVLREYDSDSQSGSSDNTDPLIKDIDNESLSDEFKQKIVEWNNKIHVLEAFNGSYYFGFPQTDQLSGAARGLSFSQANSNSNGFVISAPVSVSFNQTQLDFLQAAYDALKESIYDRLLLQTRFKNLLEMIDVSISESGVTYGFEALTESFNNKIQQNSIQGLQDLIEFNNATAGFLVAEKWNGYELFVEKVRSQQVTNEFIEFLNEYKISTSNNTSPANGPQNFRVIISEDSNDYLYTLANSGVIFGGGGNDTLGGGAGDDILYGENDDDSINGAGGNDILSGGGGNDYIRGGNGADIYIFQKGYGQDTINNWDNDTISNDLPDALLMKGIFSSEVSVARVFGDSLLISLKDNSGSVLIENYFNNDGLDGYAVEKILFEDGETWDVSYIKNLVIIPTAGDDLIVGYSHDDTLKGSSGNDLIYGRSGNDLLEGELGDDTLYGEWGNDLILGGSGQDVLFGGTDNDTLDGGEGDDSLFGEDGSDTYLFGVGSGDDFVVEDNLNVDFDLVAFKNGLSLSDVKFTRIGNSTDIKVSIVGEVDVLHINNYLYSSTNIEQFQFDDGTVLDQSAVKAILNTGTVFEDQIYGYADDDYITGNEGGDYLSGEGGNDTIHGDNGNDTLIGGIGNDILLGGDGNDLLQGGGGDDTLDGGAGNDDLDSGPFAGNDTFIFGKGYGQDRILFDQGTNSAGLSRLVFNADTQPSDINVSIQNSDLILSIAETGDSIRLASYFLHGWDSSPYQINHIEFSDGTTWDKDTLKIKVFSGTSGNDYILGDSENNLLTGQAGNDTIYSDAGSDTMVGGDGNDNISGFGLGNYLIDGGDGDDTLAGGHSDDVIYGGNGNDSILGRTGNDTIYGGDGNDNILTGEGNDYIDGGAGDDTIAAGMGTNIYLFGHGSELDEINIFKESHESTMNIVQLKEGISVSDILIKKADINSNYSLDIYINGYSDKFRINNYGMDFQNYSAKIDQIKFYDGTIWNLNDIENEILSESLSDFTFVGTSKSEVFVSESGNDIVYGNDGDDTLSGGHGNDHLYGGSGNDFLQGDEGEDSYYFELGDGQDTIYAFDQDASRNEILEFGSSIQSSQIILIKSGVDLIFSFVDSTDSVTILNYFSSYDGIDGVFALNEVRFSDGSTWNQDDILQNISSDVPNDPTQIPFVLGDGFVTQTLEDVTGGEGTSQYTVYFGSNVNLSDLTITREVHDLLITHANGVDQLRLNGVYISPNNHMRIDGLFSSQGMTFDLSVLALGVTGTEGDDNLIGQDEGDNYIMGLAGNDNLSSGNGHDTLDGGEGNDTLSAGIGNDRYEFFGNIGHDIVSESPQTEENFDYDIIYIEKLSTDVTLSRNGDNLVLILGPDDSVTLQGWYGPNGAAFEEVQFSDLSWDKATLVALAENLPSQNSNHPPVINQLITEASTTEDSQFMLDLTTAFSDPDVQDELNYGLTLENGDPLPNWMNFDPITRVLSGIPGNAEVGSINLKITATDLAGESATQTFVLTVTNTNDAPVVVGSIENQQVVDGNTYTYTIPSALFQDVDVGDTLTLSMAQSNQSPLPTWLTFDPQTLTLTGSPSAADIATPLNLTVTASDTSGSSVSTSFTLTVAAMASQSLVGTAGNDVLIGGSGNDTLNGGAGADSMSGGYGNDLYIVDNSGDVITENAGEGSDTVQAPFNYVLAANVENLTLTGTGATLGTGNALANVIIGNSGNNTLRGNGGADTLNGGAGTDTVTYSGQNPSVRVNLTTGLGKGGDAEGDVYISIENVTDSWSNDLIIGNSVANRLDGTSGNDILQGMSGNDSLADSYGRNVLDGGDGHDYIYDSDQSELIIGGKGNDEIYTGAGQDIISFNKGDGVDDYYGGAATDNTLSLGGNFSYNELSFRKSGNDLVLNVGTSQINLKSWYAATPIKSVLNLQVIAEAMADFNANGTDTMLDNKVEKFDFIGIVNQFDTALAADANLTSWSLTNALLDYHLGGSDTAAIGGDLAYQYGLNGSLAGIGLSAAQSVINSSSFGQSAQTLHASTSWQSETTKLA